MRDTGRRVVGLMRLLSLWLRFPHARRSGVFFLDRGAEVMLQPSSTLKVARGVRFMRDATIRVVGHLTIDEGTFFNRGCTIVARESVTIGRNCLFGHGVSIFDHDHRLTPVDVPPADRDFISTPVVIEDHVWIGARATILRGVTIGYGSVVGANSVVTCDVPPRTLVAGVPAKVLRDLAVGADTALAPRP